MKAEELKQKLERVEKNLEELKGKSGREIERLIAYNQGREAVLIEWIINELPRKEASKIINSIL